MAKQKQTIEMLMVNPHAAGIDIGSKEHWVAVPPGHDSVSVRCFSAFTEDLHAIAAWLKQCRVTTVAMESTGVYWIPLFLILEEYGLEVVLVNASHVKNVSGRKTDEKDCQWIQKLHTCGLLTASYQPDAKTRELRSYVRHRKNLSQSAQVHVLRMQKALEQMNIKIHLVLSDITGKSGMAIVKAVLKGQYDPEQLCKLVDPRVKASREEIKKSLKGTWKQEHLFELRQSVELYEFHEQKLAECDGQIQEVISSFSKEDEGSSSKPPEKQPGETTGLKDYLKTIFGVDITEIWGIKEDMAIELLSEIGMDMSKWKTDKHFTSWLGLCPNNKISGGKIISSKVQKKRNKAGQLFRMVAYAIQRSDHWLGSFYRKMRSKGGPKKAIVATARKLAVIFYKMVSTKQPFTPIRKEVYEEMYRTQKIKQLEKQALKLGFVLASS
jgi:transposase